MADGSIEIKPMLTPLTGKPRQRPFLVLDIESKRDFTTEAGFTRPFMVGVYDGREYYAFFDTEPPTAENWEEHYYRPGGCVDRAMRFVLQRKYQGWHIYAHNAGRFDYLFLLPWLMHIGRELGFELSVIPVASSIQVLDVWKNNRRCRHRFLDSLKLIPTSLDKAAKSFGLTGKDKSSLGKLGLDTPETDRRAWILYNRPDCVQLYRVLEKFHHYVENVLCGEVGITAPATSMKIFRRRYLKDSIPRAMDTHEFIRASYKGGRTEPFRRWGKRLRYYDINSSYPAAMLELMPAGDGTWWEGKPPKRFLDGKHVGFCEVDIEVPDSLHIPPLPITGPKGSPVEGKLIFPTGRLTGIWEYDELKMAIEVGCKVKRWKRSVWYPGKYLFKDYVHELYQYRDKKSDKYDAGLAEVVKIMLNALYGKFGMRTLRKQMFLWNDDELPDSAVPANGDPECPIWYAEVESDAPYVMPQISARVTSLARQRLYRGMLAALKAGGEVYYADTDSIITDVVIPTSTELGAFKDELPELSGMLEGEFIAPKLYTLGVPSPTAHGDDWYGQRLLRWVKAKGIEGKLKTLENFRKLSRGEKLTMTRLEKVGTLAQAGFLRGPRTVEVPRRFLAGETKRTIHEDGSSSPIRLEMWQPERKVGREREHSSAAHPA